MLIIGTVACLALTMAQAPAEANGSGSAQEPSSAEAAPAPPNFLIVLMDDVGRDKIGFCGIAKDVASTPHLDALAARGVVFDRAWAYPTCSPTRAALLSGRCSDRTGIGAVIRTDDAPDTPLPLTEHLLPEDLPGYVTTHLGKWHLGDSSSSLDHPRESGFDASISWDGRNNYFEWTEVVNGESTPKTGYYPAALGDHVIRTVQAKEAPFFAYYATRLAHTPFHYPPEKYHSQEGNSVYPFRKHKAMVEALDTVLGRILEAVDLSTTYVIVLGDNGSPGPAMGSQFGSSNNKGSVYEGGLNVPFVVAGPGVAQGARCGELVCVTDLFATVRELAGLGPPSQGAEDSISFADLLRDPTQSGGRKHLYVHRFPLKGTKGRSLRAIRDKRWKLIENSSAKTFELYDLEADPLEKNDLKAQALDYRSEDQTCAKAVAELRAHLPSFKPKPQTGTGTEKR